MVRKFPPFCSKWKKRSTSEGLTQQFPNGISGKLAYHLNSNRNFRIFWPNGKYPTSHLIGSVDFNFKFYANCRHSGFAIMKTLTRRKLCEVQPWKIPRICNNLLWSLLLTLQLWDVEAQKRVRSMPGHSARVGCLSWNSYILSRCETAL